jgi:transcriptional regulator with XRE-family HTH domain
LRAARRTQGLTIDQVAHASDLTKGFISRVERDETSPSVSSLVALCQVLSLSVGSLFTSSEIKVVSLDESPLINMGGTGVVERLLTPRSESHVQMLRSTLQPGASSGVEMYTINCEVETLHVISGQVSMRFTGKEIEMSAGDTLTFNGHEPHSWINEGAATTELMWVFVPAAWSGSS